MDNFDTELLSNEIKEVSYQMQQIRQKVDMFDNIAKEFLIIKQRKVIDSRKQPFVSTLCEIIQKSSLNSSQGGNSQVVLLNKDLQIAIMKVNNCIQDQKLVETNLKQFQEEVYEQIRQMKKLQQQEEKKLLQIDNTKIDQREFQNLVKLVNEKVSAKKFQELNDKVTKSAQYKDILAVNDKFEKIEEQLEQSISLTQLEQILAEKNFALRDHQDKISVQLNEEIQGIKKLIQQTQQYNKEIHNSNRKQIISVRQIIDKKPWNKKVQRLESTKASQDTVESIIVQYQELNHNMNLLQQQVQFTHQNQNHALERFDEVLLQKAQKDDLNHILKKLQNFVTKKQIENKLQPFDSFMAQVQRVNQKVKGKIGIIFKELQDNLLTNTSKQQQIKDYYYLMDNMKEVLETQKQKADKQDLIQLMDKIGYQKDIDQISTKLEMLQRQVQNTLLLQQEQIRQQTTQSSFRKISVYNLSQNQSKWQSLRNIKNTAANSNRISRTNLCKTSPTKHRRNLSLDVFTNHSSV